MPKPIRILHVTTSLSTNGGIEETLRILCRRMDPAVCRIGLCAIKGRPDTVLDALRSLPIDIFCGSRRGLLFDPSTSLWVRTIIREFQADIVHTHTTKGNFHGRLAALIHGRMPTVTTFHDLGDARFAVTPGLASRITRERHDDPSKNLQNALDSFVYPGLNVALNRFNAKIVCVSEAVRSVYAKPGNRDSRFEVVYAPFDDSMFRETKPLFARGLTVLGSVGRLARYKGFGYLLAAMAKLVQCRTDVRLRLIGAGELQAELAALIEQYQLAPFVELCGSRPHDANLYDGIDVYIQPSLLEGCSITLLEAMGQGIPTIASDIDGPRELIVDGKTGLLVPPRDPESLANAMLLLIDDRQRAIRLGQAGQQRAMAMFSAAVFTERMTRIYQEIAAANSR